MFSFEGVLIRGGPAVLPPMVSSFEGVLVREVSAPQGVLISGGSDWVPAVLPPKVSSFERVLIGGVPAVLPPKVPSFQGSRFRGS